MRRLKYLISWVIIATLVAGCGKKSNDDSETSLTTSEATTEISTTEKPTTEEIVEEIPFENPYLVDYMIIANAYEWMDVEHWGTNVDPYGDGPSNVVTGFELLDADQDGNLELFMNMDDVEENYYSGMHQPLITFDADVGMVDARQSTSPAGDSKFYIDEEKQSVYIKTDYATKYTYIGFATWTAEGWVTDTVYEQDGEEVLQCKWEGSDVDKDTWGANAMIIEQYRDLNDKISECLTIDSDASAKTVAETLYSYYQSKNIAVSLLENASDGELYLVLPEYAKKMWKTQTLDLAPTSNLTCILDETITYGLIVRPTETGSCVFAGDFGRISVDDVKYENGVVITSDDEDYLFEVSDNGFCCDNPPSNEVADNNIVAKMLSSKWYTISMANIMEFEFFEDGTGICITYNVDNGDWEEIDRFSCEYEYLPEYDQYTNVISIGYGQYGMIYSYRSGALIDDYTLSYTSDYYKSDRLCLVPRDTRPDYDTLSLEYSDILNY